MSNSKRQAASILDVARAARVSIATVSRVINNQPVVAEATRRRVSQVIRSLDYIPSVAARSLKLRPSRLVGLLVPDIENPFYATMAKHVEIAAHKAGVNIVLGNTGGDPVREKHYIKILADRLIDGILLCRTAYRQYRIQDVMGRSIPCVVLDRYAGRETLPSVRIDNARAGRLAANHLLALGHTRFACIYESHKVIPLWQRKEAFAEEVRKNGGRVREEDCIETGERINDATAIMKKMLRGSPGRRVSAIYCSNDLLAFGVMQAVLALGLRIPDDLSIVGTDNVDQCLNMMPKLTTVAQPFQDIAGKAIELLLDSREGEFDQDLPIQDVLLAPYLVIRESTGVPRRVEFKDGLVGRAGRGR
ncbi:MAG: LacI family transcriptional regulator [Planctomycetota bacterium]|jgi:LacI family transcriptional regulator|nr:LacI family transcriptional regulator [Planctomycetota bacterium]